MKSLLLVIINLLLFVFAQAQKSAYFPFDNNQIDSIFIHILSDYNTLIKENQRALIDIYKNDDFNKGLAKINLNELNNIAIRVEPIKVEQTGNSGIIAYSYSKNRKNHIVIDISLIKSIYFMTKYRYTIDRYAPKYKPLLEIYQTHGLEFKDTELLPFLFSMIEAIPLTKNENKQIDNLFITSLSFVVYHEIFHLANNHGLKRLKINKKIYKYIQKDKKPSEKLEQKLMFFETQSDVFALCILHLLNKIDGINVYGEPLALFVTSNLDGMYNKGNPHIVTEMQRLAFLVNSHFELKKCTQNNNDSLCVQLSDYTLGLSLAVLFFANLKDVEVTLDFEKVDKITDDLAFIVYDELFKKCNKKNDLDNLIYNIDKRIAKQKENDSENVDLYLVAAIYYKFKFKSDEEFKKYFDKTKLNSTKIPSAFFDNF